MVASVTVVFTEYGWEVMERPPYSPDSSLLDLHWHIYIFYIKITCYSISMLQFVALFWANASFNLAHSVQSAAILWYSLCLKNLLMSSVHLSLCLRGLLPPFNCQNVIIFDRRLFSSLLKWACPIPF